MSVLHPSETRTRRAVRRATIDSGLVRLNASSKPTLEAIPVGSVKDIPDLPSSSLISTFVQAHEQFEAYKNGTKSITVDGRNLSIAGLVAAARLPHHSTVVLDNDPRVKNRVDQSQQAMVDKVDRNVSVYGVSTGFGGSADTRTGSVMILGDALLEMQQCGVISHELDTVGSVLPLSNSLISTSMPESWVRGAIAIRMNALIRGHSGVRWELIERMNVLLEKNIVPLVPMRGSISASGDLSPLSYIAGAVIGSPSIKVYYTPQESDSKAERKIVPSSTAFSALNTSPLPSLAPKEHLGILNGTAFSASVGSLALWDSVQMVLGGVVCTALGAEAMAGSRGNYVPFIHKEARPHPGQVESASLIAWLLEDSKFAIPPANDDEPEGEVNINDDQGELKQDRYPLRTAPQFLGPQLEDVKSAWDALNMECNSTTDNPLVEVTKTTLGAPRAKIHNGGNFQAMAVTNAMEKTRLSLQHVGKLLFAQCAEMVDNKSNRGLPPNLSLGDPSLDYCMKGIDISTAAYVSELGFLANPVSTHVQSAEMHNQAVNSLALISARQTMNSLEVLGLLMASYLYAICQALDLRALQLDMYNIFERVIREEVAACAASSVPPAIVNQMVTLACESLDKTTGLDAGTRMEKVSKDTCSTVVDWALEQPDLTTGGVIASVPALRATLAEKFTNELQSLRNAYASGERSAAMHLGRTKPVYDWVRKERKVPMRAWPGYAKAHGEMADTIGENITRIYEGIRDLSFQSLIVKLFAAA